MIQNNYTQRNLLEPIDGFPDLSRKRNLASIVAVSDHYIDYALKYLHKLSSWDVCILTDKPERFEGFFYVEKYNNSVFSLGDKIIFSLRMSMKFKSGITHIDADELDAISEDFINKRHTYENFVCMSYAKICRTIRYDRLLGKMLAEHLDLLGLPEGEFLYVINEKVYYVPYTDKLPEMIYYNEIIKPSVDHAAMWQGNRRQITGEGEGASLAISLYRVGIEVEFYDVRPLPKDRE